MQQNFKNIFLIVIHLLGGDAVSGDAVGGDAVGGDAVKFCFNKFPKK